MPDLSDDQLQRLRQTLDRREVELRGEVEAKRRGAEAVPSREPHNQVEDLGEQGEQRIRDAVVQAEQERDLDELRQIGEAKARMLRGEYGTCVDCGVDIPFARLEVQPGAARCIACQEKYEATHDTAARIPPMGA